jgi:hypothetical protein
MEVSGNTSTATARALLWLAHGLFRLGSHFRYYQALGKTLSGSAAGSALICRPDNSGSTPTDNPTTTQPSNPTGPHKNVAGIGLGVGFGVGIPVLLLISVTSCLLIRRRGQMYFHPMTYSGRLKQKWRRQTP